MEDPEKDLRDAEAAGVGPVLAVAMGTQDGERGLALQRRFPGAVLAGAGLHPSRVPELDDAALAVEIAGVERQAPEAAFIGEIGLDFRDAPGDAQQRRQREVLETLLDLAERLRLPVNLHTRRADRELLEAAAAFTRRTGLPALLHWFTHSRKLARRCAEEGIFISAGPSVEIDPRQAEVARSIHPDFLLVETDSPVEYAGRAARPAWARRVADSLARIRGEDPDALREALAANLRRYLQRTPPAVPERLPFW